MVEATLADEHRVCTHCGETKPLSEYGKGERNKAIRKHVCKRCVYKRQRGWEASNVERHRRTAVDDEAPKICRICAATKPAAEFWRRANTKGGTDSACQDCLRQRDRDRYQQHTASRKAQARKGQLKLKFGLTEEQWAALVRQQHGRCAICQRLLGEREQICVDHDHNTDRVRGILCRKCNFALGLLGDDPACADAAAAYLRKHAHADADRHRQQGTG